LKRALLVAELETKALLDSTLIIVTSKHGQRYRRGAVGVIAWLERTNSITSVGTTQVAPTILRALGLDPKLPQAVSKENTAELPSLF